MKFFITLIFLCSMSSTPTQSFKEAQLAYERVRDANNRLGSQIDELLIQQRIGTNPFDLYLRAFKEEGELEAWTRTEGSDAYELLRTYTVCAKSGGLGPKRKQGDLQVPEGFYHIDRFNPMSNYHLSLGINYPNASDRILSHANRPGGDIFIHGNCVTIGCLPITDAYIEELYLLCVEAKDRGLSNIPVTIFPMRMSMENYVTLKQTEPNNADAQRLWSELKSAYDHFEQGYELPSIRFEKDGSQQILD